MDESFIYEIKNNLPSNLCKAVIKKFESNSDQFRDGVVGEDTTNKSWKDSKEIQLTEYPQSWDKLYEKVVYFITKGLIEYKKEFTKFLDKTIGIDGDTNFVKHFSLGTITALHCISIQRIAGGSRYRWHSDYSGHHPSRILTFMWYLNTLEEDEGGKTAFINGRKVRPEEGKLIFFPATWTGIHCGELIKTEYKYIMVGTLNRIIDGNVKE